MHGNVRASPMLDNSGGYGLYVCNASQTQSHTLQAVTIQIAALTPYSGQLNELPACTGDYRRGGGVFNGGCGGGYYTDENLSATFPSGAGAGTTVTATQVGYNKAAIHPVTPLPMTLAPGQSLALQVAIAFSPAPAPGFYTFAFGFVVDGAAPSYVASAPAVLLAPIARKWTGQACDTPAMLAQIPASSTDRYVCPSS